MEKGPHLGRPPLSLFCAASLVIGGVLWPQDEGPKVAAGTRPTNAGEQRDDISGRPEFRTGTIERGEADEPDIAHLGADWSHEVELRATVDRQGYRQLQRVRVVCQIRNVSGQNNYWVPPNSLEDRYLKTRIRVFDNKGKLVPMTEFYKHEGRQPTFHIAGGGGGLERIGHFLAPSRSFRIDVVPNLVYDMTRPGEYWVLVEMQFGSKFPPDAKGDCLFYARANPIKVKVTPEILDYGPKGNLVRDPDRP
jgi:hypothetical protein